eukprot:3063022-Ditylum_brightwellii.AAC.1
MHAKLVQVVVPRLDRIEGKERLVIAHLLPTWYQRVVAASVGFEPFTNHDVWHIYWCMPMTEVMPKLVHQGTCISKTMQQIVWVLPIVPEQFSPYYHVLGVGQNANCEGSQAPDMSREFSPINKIWKSQQFTDVLHQWVLT